MAVGGTGSPPAKLSIAMRPERLGARTTVYFALHLAQADGGTSSPLTRLELLYPANLGIGTSGLGFATCEAAQLETTGLTNCSAESVMGRGEAVVDVPIGPRTIAETTRLTLLAGPGNEGHLGLFFFAAGSSPVVARLVFPGVLLPAPVPYGGDVSIELNPVTVLPEGPEVSVVEMRGTIGPSGITYYRNVAGKVVPYQPEGIVVPDVCPRGGFPFSARLTFEDGHVVTARTTAPCPAKPGSTPGARTQARPKA
jgi:hypothetical protein